MTTIKVNQQINSLAIIIAIVQLSGILLVRLAKCIKGAVVSCYTWLVTMHDFSNEEGDIYLSGIQYIGIGVIIAVVCFVLSIQF